MELLCQLLKVACYFFGVGLVLIGGLGVYFGVDDWVGGHAPEDKLEPLRVAGVLLAGIVLIAIGWPL